MPRASCRAITAGSNSTTVTDSTSGLSALAAADQPMGEPDAGIVGDDDGLVALAPATVRARIGDAQAKLAREAQWEADLAAGRPVHAIFGIEPAVTPGA